MNLYPAIDVLDGKAVRLLKGNYDNVTVYGDPLDMALKWKQQGATFLHIVDLNGAKGDGERNVAKISEIIKKCDIQVQVGGGIRTMSDITLYLECGAARVILGTACIRTPELIKEAVIKYGADKIVCGVDAKEDKVAVNGWLDDTAKTPLALCLEMKSLGVNTIVYTDIKRDGTLCGSNIQSTKRLTAETKMNIIASGGVSSLADIKELKAENIYGAILGKALYENKIDLMDAINLAGEFN